MDKYILKIEDLKNSRNPSYYEMLFPSMDEEGIKSIKSSLEEVLTKSSNLLSNKQPAVIYNEETYDSFNSILVSFYRFQSYEEYKSFNKMIFKNTNHMKNKYKKYVNYYNKLILPKEMYNLYNLYII